MKLRKLKKIVSLNSHYYSFNTAMHLALTKTCNQLISDQNT